ncbi:MAG: hypothetical protein RMJ43_05985 [Chloroherpetonaceae bacterium]|nr:hypothetical protein [Chthonomonadaceae bacterium]MDW8207367.1 hypothetical protein [Chloroherpetonaceae bacterium]
MYRVGRPALRSLLLVCAVAGFGVAGVLSPDASSRVAGWLVVLGSGGGLVVWLLRWFRWWRSERWCAEQERIQFQKRALRQGREAAQRARQQAVREARARAEERSGRARAASRRVLREQDQLDRARAQSREAALEAAVARLCALAEGDFAREVQEILARRGYTVELARAHGPVELVLHAPGECRLEVACILPGGQAATVDAGNALEAWRAECGARHAFLVSRGGFAPELVRVAARRAVTLVEPYLLASWQLSATSSEPGTERGP